MNMMLPQEEQQQQQQQEEEEQADRDYYTPGELYQLKASCHFLVIPSTSDPHQIFAGSSDVFLGAPEVLVYLEERQILRDMYHNDPTGAPWVGTFLHKSQILYCMDWGSTSFPLQHKLTRLLTERQ